MSENIGKILQLVNLYLKVLQNIHKHYHKTDLICFDGFPEIYLWASGGSWGVLTE